MNKNFSISQYNIDKIINLYNKYKFKCFDDFLDHSLPILEWAFKTQLQVKEDIVEESIDDTK